MNITGLTRVLKSFASLTIAVLLISACGDDSASPTGPITVTGTAATGMAITNGNVEIRCLAGSASATTAADGTYSIELAEDAELPCLLRVTLPDGSMLHSVLAVDSTVANITTVTELVVTRLAGGSAADYFDGFDSAAAARLAEDDFNFGLIQGAVDAVVAILGDAGVDFGPKIVNSVLTGTLVAAHDGQPGNAYDDQLDVLSQKLVASGTTLATLADEIVRSIPNDSAGLSDVASLPASLLLSPAAPNCTALRSGSYRLLVLAASAGADVPTEVANINAASLTLTRADGSVEQWIASGDCTYTTAAGEDAVVSQAGLIVARVAVAGGGYAGALLFSEQVVVDETGAPTSMNIAQLAGNWNTLALEQTFSGGPVHLTTSTYTLNGAGQVKALTVCDSAVSSCTTSPFDQVPDIQISFNTAEGGFNVENKTAGRSARAFAYRAGGGHLMLVTLTPDGQLGFSTLQLAALLPTVDTVSESWNLALARNLAVAPGFTNGKSTVTAVDDAVGQYESTAVINFDADITRPETIIINDPREGYRYRPEATVTDSNGGSTVVTEQLALPLLGMGLVSTGVLVDNSLSLAVQKLVN
jgi:hypothetical protein